jgi:hypothetical protein
MYNFHSKIEENSIPGDSIKVESLGCFLQGDSTEKDLKITKFSGDPIWDLAMNQEYFFLQKIFTVIPEIYYYDDRESPNAFASPEITNLNLPDGTTYFGFKMIINECSQSLGGSCSAVPIIMAHEFAHIVDFKFSVYPNTTGKHPELFADYLAGCYMYYRSTQFRALNVQEAANSFFKKGDFDFWSQLHHGTPQERITCLMAGYNLALINGSNLNLSGAIENAKAYVSLF